MVHRLCASVIVIVSPGLITAMLALVVFAPLRIKHLPHTYLQVHPIHKMVVQRLHQQYRQPQSDLQLVSSQNIDSSLVATLSVACCACLTILRRIIDTIGVNFRRGG